ncbi:MAG: hypothetical protein GY866_42750 [Proteobacteria bacterium]|nr:hypothetical protein [Pseudomonadota bacterium]
MSTAKKQQGETPQDKAVFKRQVDLFVKHHRKKQEKLEQEKKRRNMTLADVIKKAPPLPDEAINVFFGINQNYQVSTEVLNEVRDVLKSMQDDINTLAPQKRFFILETINFFSSKIGIGKLIPALLVLKGEDQRKAICEFAFPTFLSINKNVEILAADNDLFDPDRLHIDRGGLYTFVSDVSKILIELFREDFIEEVSKGRQSLEFLLKGFDPVTFRLDGAFEGDSEFIYQEMIDDEDEIRNIVLRFIVAIQSHEVLYNYSLKRYRYYKKFLAGLTETDRFKGVDPIDISKILAGCLVANDQLKPNDELIDNMIDEGKFNSKATLEARKKFVDGLSPGNIYKLIGRLRVSLQHISKSNFGNEFQDVQKFSVKTILNNVWKGFIRLVETGLSLAAEPFYQVFQQVKRTYESFVADEKQKEETMRSGMVEQPPSKDGTVPFIPKNLESFAVMSQHFTLVETDIVGFRGEYEGAGHRDFGFNTRFFRKDKRLTVRFLECFNLLFQTLKKDKKVKEINLKNQKNIVEYFASYVFGNHLVCFGLTHLLNPRTPMVEKKDIFPYVLLFAESKQKKTARVLGREVVVKDQLKIFNEVPFEEKTAIHFYESLYLILHLLREDDWKTKNAQACIAFLIRELHRLIKRKQKLRYIVEIPALPTKSTGR